MQVPEQVRVSPILFFGLFALLLDGLGSLTRRFHGISDMGVSVEDSKPMSPLEWFLRALVLGPH